MKINKYQVLGIISGCFGLLLLSVAQYTDDWHPVRYESRVAFALVLMVSVLLIVFGLGTIKGDKNVSNKRNKN